MAFPSIPDALKNGRIAVCGLGLIGGSVVRALRARGFQGHITGHDVDAALLRQLLLEGWINAIAEPPATLFAEHDLVLLCQPVGVLCAFIEQHAADIGRGRAVGIDVASVKAPVLAALRAGGEAAVARFVPSHPIAGKARHGWAAGDADLFAGKRCVLTPDARTAAPALACAEAFWALLGAQVTQMPAAQHDQVYAALSHLPQLLSYAYLHSLAQREGTRDWLAYQGSGFQGFTRLGGSDAALWADIAIHNTQPLIAEIDRLGDALGLIRQHLAQGDAPALAAAFAQARDFHGMSVAAPTAAPVSLPPQQEPR
ncbi:prephenate dehydrogenase [Xylophilus sp. GW821-FHT01B05]